MIYRTPSTCVLAIEIISTILKKKHMENKYLNNQQNQNTSPKNQEQTPQVLAHSSFIHCPELLLSQCIFAHRLQSSVACLSLQRDLQTPHVFGHSLAIQPPQFTSSQKSFHFLQSSL